MTEQELRETVGRRVRHLRRKKHMTQVELGKLCGIKSTSFVCEIEKGRTTMSLKTLHNLEQILGDIW